MCALVTGVQTCALPISDAAATQHQKLASLSGDAFDTAYVKNEVAYHATVNGALADTLIPSADNAELKALLETGLTLFREHHAHAEQLAGTLDCPCPGSPFSQRGRVSPFSRLPPPSAPRHLPTSKDLRVGNEGVSPCNTR